MYHTSQSLYPASRPRTPVALMIAAFMLTTGVGCDSKKRAAVKQYEQVLELVSPGMTTDEATKVLTKAGIIVTEPYRPSAGPYYHVIIYLRTSMPEFYGYLNAAGVRADPFHALVLETDLKGIITCVDVGRANIRAGPRSPAAPLPMSIGDLTDGLRFIVVIVALSLFAGGIVCQYNAMKNCRPEGSWWNTMHAANFARNLTPVGQAWRRRAIICWAGLIALATLVTLINLIHGWIVSPNLNPLPSVGH